MKPYTTTPTEYLRRKFNLTQRTYIRRNGKGFYLIEGKEIPAEEWEEMNKLPTSLVLGRTNPDKLANGFTNRPPHLPTRTKAL